jgi:hypothetical protein
MEQYKLLFFISKMTFPSRKMSKIRMGFFFYFLSFANFLHISDENLALINMQNAKNPMGPRVK